MIGEMSVVPRVAKPFGSSLLESYWPEAEHLSNGLGSAVSFKIPMFGYVAPSSFFGEAQVVDFARVSRRSRVRYWVRSGLIPSRAKALVWSGVGRA